MPFVTASFGPAITAVLLRPLRPKRGTFRGALTWPGVALAIGLGAVGTAGSVVFSLGGAIDLHAAAAALGSYGPPVAFLAVYALMGPVSEEPGWRGFLYPLLRRRLGLGQIGLLFGPVWALWHLPLFFIDGTYQHQLGILTVGGLDFLIETVGLTVLVSFTFERWGLIAGMIVHFTANTLPSVLGITGTAALTADAAAKLLTAAAIVFLTYRIERANGDSRSVPDGIDGDSARLAGAQERAVRSDNRTG